MRRSTAAVLATFAAGFGALAGAALGVQSAGHARSHDRSCVAPGAHVLARGTAVRVYEPRHPSGAPRAVWACLAGHRGHLTLLAPTRLNLRTSLDDFRLAGHIAAYLETQFGVDTGTTKIVVVDVGARRVLHSIRAGSYANAGLIFSEAVDRFIVTSSGAIAWTATRSERGRPGPSSVYAAPREGEPVLLDSGDAIDAGSLAISGSTLTWNDAGTARTAPLP